MFQHGARGVRFTFDNGYAISIQWGGGSYSDNYHGNFTDTEVPDSTTAETAIINPDGDLIRLPGDSDTVRGYQTAEQVAQLIEYTRSLPKE